MVSHDLQQVREIADHVVVFRHGVVAAEWDRGEYSGDDVVAAITEMCIRDRDWRMTILLRWTHLFPPAFKFRKIICGRRQSILKDLCSPPLISQRAIRHELCT